jgi:hypothetical protein
MEFLIEFFFIRTLLIFFIYSLIFPIFNIKLNRTFFFKIPFKKKN